MTASAITMYHYDFAEKVFPIPSGLTLEKVSAFERVRNAFCHSNAREPISLEAQQKFVHILEHPPADD